MQTGSPSIAKIATMVLFTLSCIGLLLFLWLSFGGTIVLAMLVAFQPSGEHVYGPLFLLMALFLGLGTGGVFGWVGRATPAKNVGTVGGIIAAAGGLGGYARYVAICPPSTKKGTRISRRDAPLPKFDTDLHWDTSLGYRVR